MCLSSSLTPVHLPPELILAVFKYLDPCTLARLTHESPYFAKLLNSKGFWKDYGHMYQFCDNSSSSTGGSTVMTKDDVFNAAKEQFLQLRFIQETLQLATIDGQNPRCVLKSRSQHPLVSTGPSHDSIYSISKSDTQIHLQNLVTSQLHILNFSNRAPGIDHVPEFTQVFSYQDWDYALCVSSFGQICWFRLPRSKSGWDRYDQHVILLGVTVLEMTPRTIITAIELKNAHTLMVRLRNCGEADDPNEYWEVHYLNRFIAHDGYLMVNFRKISNVDVAGETWPENTFIVSCDSLNSNSHFKILSIDADGTARVFILSDASVQHFTSSSLVFASTGAAEVQVQRALMHDSVLILQYSKPHLYSSTSSILALNFDSSNGEISLIKHIQNTAQTPLAITYSSSAFLITSIVSFGNSEMFEVHALTRQMQKLLCWLPSTSIQVCQPSDAVDTSSGARHVCQHSSRSKAKKDTILATKLYIAGFSGFGFGGDHGAIRSEKNGESNSNTFKWALLANQQSCTHLVHSHPTSK